MQPAIAAVALVYLYVRDLARAAAFYTEALGLAFTVHGEDWAEARLADGVRFALHGTAKDPQTPGTVRVNFETDDLDEARARLERAGATVGPDTEAPTGTFFEFTDVEGYRLAVFRPRR